jgi:hypothetical protein
MFLAHTGASSSVPQVTTFVLTPSFALKYACGGLAHLTLESLEEDAALQKLFLGHTVFSGPHMHTVAFFVLPSVFSQVKSNLVVLHTWKAKSPASGLQNIAGPQICGLTVVSPGMHSHVPAFFVWPSLFPQAGIEGAGVVHRPSVMAGLHQLFSSQSFAPLSLPQMHASALMCFPDSALHTGVAVHL